MWFICVLLWYISRKFSEVFMQVKVKNLVMKQAKGKDCTLVWCIDPKTKMVKLAVEGKCPKGYRRRVVREANEALGRGVIAPRDDED